MKTSFHSIVGFALAACLVASQLGAQTLSDADSITQSAPIPMDQLGVVASERYQGGGLSVITTTDGARVRCGFQRLEGDVTSDGLWLNSTADGSSGERFRVMAVKVKRDTSREAAGIWPTADPFSRTQPGLVSEGGVVALGRVVRFVRPGLTEEYSVSVDGVRQDFIVDQWPKGNGELCVELDITGAKAEPQSNGVRLVLNDSGRNVIYHRLQVTDARGRELAASLEVTDETHLTVVVEDANAVYPVRIDPTFSDADWISIGGLPGADGTVSAVAFDGSGNLFIGGSCNVVGNIVAKQIAKWDGNSWSSLGGINGTVSALAVSGTDLFVGGSFNVVGVDMGGGIVVSNIAKWNGSSWSSLDTGVFGPVTALAVSDSDLYVAGSFSLAGDVFALRVAKWDGSTWSGLGSGLNNAVNSLAVIGGDLYAGGAFTLSGATSVLKIAKWNGSTWSALGTGIGGGASPVVNALAVVGTDLYAAGTFTIAGSVSPANNIAKWNGSAWSALGTGLGGTANSMAISGNDLYVGGSFTTPATRIAKWDGVSWTALGSGMSGTVAALATYGSTVAAGGSFTTTPAMRVATWNGTTWTNLGAGLNNPANAIAVSGGDVYLGGAFTFRGVPGAVNIVRWNGSAWSALAGGLNGSVGALVFSGGNLYAGGAFTTATNTGGATVTVNHIAKWNGSAWSALEAGIGGASSPVVVALAVVGTDLYAGGGFSTAGSVPAYNIARWNGSLWSAVGEGVSSTVNGAVNALATVGNDIYVAGDFTTATNVGGVAVPVGRIAKWDGNAWSALGLGMNAEVNALAVSGVTLYAGGFFNMAGTTAVGRIAQWDGNAWSALGPATNNIFVYALAVSGNDLYVGGTFTTVGGTPGVPANNIAKWDGSTWTALGSGMSGTSIPSVSALAVAAANLYVSGSFSKAGNKAAGYIGKATIGGAAAPGRFSNLMYSPVTGFSCTFLDATVGQSYRIQSSPSLAAGSWTDFTNFNYTMPIVITDSSAITGTNKFFRAITP